MKNVMTKAVQLAKKMEGDWVARMSMALKMAWAITKKSVKITIGKDLKVLAVEIKEAFLEEIITVSTNVWEKYGKRRIYVNVGPEKLGYFDFNEDGDLNKAYCEWDMGAATSQFNVIKRLLANGNF